MNQNQHARPGDAMGRSPLLLIDDNPENLTLLERMLEWAGYANVHTCTNGQAGLEALPVVKPHLIILDLMMPGMDGFEFLARLRDDPSAHGYLPVLVFTANLASEARTRALDLGAADFLTKPGDALEIQLRVRNFLRMRNMHADLEDQNRALEAKVRERTKHLEVARLEAIEVLASACEYRDDETGMHARRVGELSAAIAGELGLADDRVEAIGLAAPLHDLGKIAIPDVVLFKAGRLSDEEYELMKRHPGIGADLLGEKTSPLLQLAKEIALYHHERWDGTGYEAGLAGEAIPISARIVAVADAFDAMTHDRPYRDGRSRYEALAEIRSLAGSQFDPAVVDALCRCLEVEGEDLGEAA